MDTALQKHGALLLVKASVDGLQSIDFKQVIFAKNELTKKQKSVNSQLFFDISKVFPVGGEYRDPSKITAHSQAESHRMPETVTGGISRN